MNQKIWLIMEKIDKLCTWKLIAILFILTVAALIISIKIEKNCSEDYCHDKSGIYLGKNRFGNVIQCGEIGEDNIVTIKEYWCDKDFKGCCK